MGTIRGILTYTSAYLYINHISMLSIIKTDPFLHHKIDLKKDPKGPKTYLFLHIGVQSYFL